jgi:hypothetical protein
MTVKIPNQANYQDNQNLDIDIDKIYTDFIQEIDASRSIVNISNQGNQAFLNNLNKNNITSLAKLVKVETTPQESRCHAFFRLIGFPVVAEDGRYYNPGFDIVKTSSKTITIEKKIEIANNSIKGFRALSFRRETYVNSILQTFSLNESISAIALALSSSTQIRNFSVPVTVTDNFDTSIESQSYASNLLGQIGKYNNVSLLEYVDEGGNKPILSKLNKIRYHFIKPFVVDPRIDFSVAPAHRKVAVPFVTNKSDLLISENTYVKRPLLEKVIRERFALQNPNDVIGVSGQNIRNYILNVPSVRDDPLIKQMVDDVFNLNEVPQFEKFLNIIRTMLNRLVDSQKTIQVVQSKYYWLPIPSTTGPEGGCTVKSVIISENIPDGPNNSFITTADRALITNILKQAANQFNAQTAQVDGTPDVGGFAFDNFKLTFDTDTSEALGDIVSGEVSRLSRQRTKDMSDANEALRAIEIIMGEFSGLGLCDIVAIMGALYIMPKEDLLGFLDEDAFPRMIDALDLQISGLTNPGLEKAMTSFVAKVTDFYNLMDKIYQDLKNNNGLS